MHASNWNCQSSVKKINKVSWSQNVIRCDALEKQVLESNVNFQ